MSELIDGHEVTPHFPPDQPVTDSGPARRQYAWMRTSPLVSTSHPGLARALHRSRNDLGSLRIPPPGLAEHTDEVLRALGKSDDDIAALRASGACG